MNRSALWIFRFQVGRPERPRPLGSYAAPHQTLAACAYGLSSLSPCAAWASSPKARAGCGSSAVSGSVEGVVSNHDPYSDSWVGENSAF